MKNIHKMYSLFSGQVFKLNCAAKNGHLGFKAYPYRYDL